MPERTSHLGLYRADLTSPAHRRHITVGRRDFVEDTLEILRGSMDRKSKHHFLFIGPRGIGKTHLLARVADEVTEDKDLSRGYVVARFPEESNRVLSFADFLLRLCELLRDALPEEPEWAELYDALFTEEDDSLIVDRLVPHIRRSNQEKERTVLVMLENLNELFTRQIKNKKDLGALRKFFMNDNGCLLLATAPLHFDTITNVGAPFYDFFDTQILDNLTEEDTIELIRLNLEWDEKVELLKEFEDMRPKLLALYRMTGGNPRLTIMLYELIAYDSITKVRQQFEILLDRISPFYQDRLNDLPPQERAVLETMASMRDQEKTPDAIAARMRMTQPQTSALLKRLAEARYIRSTPHPKDKRRRLYNIREGFFDIWLGMNVSRGARQRIPYLLDFFAMFYPSREERNRKREELRKKLESEAKRLDAEGVLDYLTDVGDADERARAKLDLAGIHVGKGDEETASNYLREARSLSLDPLGRWIVDHAEASTDYLSEIDEMIECWDQHRSGELEAFAERLIAMGDTLSFKSFSETKLAFLREHLVDITDSEKRVKLRVKIASVLADLARWDEAEEQLGIASEEVDHESLWYSVVLNDLALLLMDTNRLEEAEPLMRRVLEIDDAKFGREHPNVAIDLINLASLLQVTNRIKEAEPLLRRALEIDEIKFGKNHPNVARDLSNLSTLLKSTDRLEEAEAVMLRALDIDENSFGEDHPDVAIDLNNLGLLLHETNRSEEAEPLLRRALEFNEASFGRDHPNVAIDLNNLALLLHSTNRPTEAELLMRRALGIDEASFGREHPRVAIRLNNLAHFLLETGEWEKSELLMLRALQIVDRFNSRTNRQHSDYEHYFKNYVQLLESLDFREDEIASKLEPFSLPSSGGE